MTSIAIASASAAAASQSTVFVTMVDDGEGSGSGSTVGGSISGNVFGVAAVVCSYATNFFRVDLASSASGQSFFRQVRVNDSILLNSSAATYSSANNTWTWAQSVGAGTFTLRFFR